MVVNVVRLLIYADICYAVKNKLWESSRIMRTTKNCKAYLIVMMSKCNKQKVFLYAKYIYEYIILIFFWFGGEIWPGHVFVRFTKLNYSCESLCICMSVGVWEEGNENKEYLNSLPSQKKQTRRKKNLYVFRSFSLTNFFVYRQCK